LKFLNFRPGKSKEEIYLSLVMEFMPTTVCRHVGKMKSLKNICHRDVKPENILLDPETGVLKLGDLGSAKQLVKGEHNVSYICSRYCRPPGVYL